MLFEFKRAPVTAVNKLRQPNRKNLDLLVLLVLEDFVDGLVFDPPHAEVDQGVLDDELLVRNVGFFLIEKS